MVLAPAHQNVTHGNKSEIASSVHDACPSYNEDVVHEIKCPFTASFIAMNQLEVIL